MAVSRYITREEFESKHGENIRRLDLLADGMVDVKKDLVEVKAQHDEKIKRLDQLAESEVDIKKDLVEVKAILKSVGFNGSSKLVREFLEFAPELIREGRELREQRALWEAHALIMARRQRQWATLAERLSLPRRVALGTIVVLGGLASLAIFVGWFTSTFHGIHIQTP